MEPTFIVAAVVTRDFRYTVRSPYLLDRPRGQEVHARQDVGQRQSSGVSVLKYSTAFLLVATSPLILLIIFLKKHSASFQTCQCRESCLPQGPHWWGLSFDTGQLQTVFLRLCKGDSGSLKKGREVLINKLDVPLSILKILSHPTPTPVHEVLLQSTLIVL